MKTITAKQLTDAGACAVQIRTFRKLFGANVNVTEARARKTAQVFSYNWAADNLLSPEARAARDKAHGTARAAYIKAVGPASAAYDKALGPASAAYDKAIAVAFARCYLEQ